MIEHWYQYLPAAWFTPEGKWILLLSTLLIFLIGFLFGYCFCAAKNKKNR